MYRIEYYHDDSGRYAAKTCYAATEREARRAAAEMLGTATLRGASTWSRYQGGTVFQFGPRNENNDSPFAVIVSIDEEREQEREERRARFS